VESVEAYNQWLTQTASEPTAIKNQAVAEHIQVAKTLFKSGWYTVAPDQPAVANKRKVSNDT
ncbi:MAG: cytochrome c oxidase subunit II, partial [Nostoc sp.]